MAKNISTKSIINLLEEIEYSGIEALNIFSRYELIEKYKSGIKFYQEYIIKENDKWDLIAYNFYGTEELWWLIAIFNSVVDPFQKLQAGNTLKIIQSQYLQEILLAFRRATLQNKK